MVEDFLNYLRYELNRAPLTVEAYRNDISQFRLWISPKDPELTDFLSVTANDVRAWLAFQAKNGDTPRTLRRKIISLRSLFKWMVKTDKIKFSPIRDLPLPKIPKPLPDFIKPSEIEESIQNLEDEALGREESGLLDLIVVEMLYSLGIRRAELVAINDSDISFSKNEVKVTGKRSKQRVVPVPAPLLSKIKEWQEVRNQTCPPPEDDSPLLVIKGKRITPQQVYRIVNRALQNSSARKKSPHALRHSFASAMLNGGAELDSVREFLGHSSLSTTQIYTHISFKEIQKAYSQAHPRSGSSEETSR